MRRLRLCAPFAHSNGSAYALNLPIQYHYLYTRMLHQFLTSSVGRVISRESHDDHRSVLDCPSHFVVAFTFPCIAVFVTTTNLRYLKIQKTFQSWRNQSDQNARERPERNSVEPLDRYVEELLVGKHPPQNNGL
jgi:hypothetical protein